jgi:hypothetical protein
MTAEKRFEIQSRTPRFYPGIVGVAKDVERACLAKIAEINTVPLGDFGLLEGIVYTLGHARSFIPEEDWARLPR